MLLLWCLAAVAAATAETETLGDACDLTPDEGLAAKSPGDNFYKLIVNGDVEMYEPGQRYVVTLVGSRTHRHVQQFTRFKLIAQPQEPPPPRASPRRRGQFQLFADTLSKFSEHCTNEVVEADDLPKTEVAVMWKAPPAGSGCIVLKAMVVEEEGRWFAEDGQLSRRLCEDTSRLRSECCACDDAKYKMVFQGLWSPETHPKDFPKQAMWLTHFSDIIGATHPKNFTFWGEGEIATDGFRSLAEWGSPGALEAELRQRGGLRSLVKAPGLWHPRVNQNTSALFAVDRRRHLLSLVSMFGPSPDWVVGVSGLDLCRSDCTWEEDKVIDLLPYDAGTDSGISYMSANAETVPREKMYRITTMYPEDPRAPFYNPEQQHVPPLARLHLRREKVVPRACDHQTLASLASPASPDLPEDETSDKPECAVGAWGAWSACSVSCGKGLRQRERRYEAPRRARDHACERQLRAREMCAAPVPECPNATEPEEADELESPLEDLSGVCRTTEWGPWSECSVTCGIGMNTRRRTFIDHMGHKKCPLVAIEESRKCMQPECSEAEAAGAEEALDPGCPVSAWSAWSPCSARCGRGVALRTRLLLAPPERAPDCAARRELLQQRPCLLREDCTIDMLTAKKICMEAADRGPCRGVYRRWWFSPERGACEPFQYGGCRGNSNNFISQEECFDTCKVVLGDGATGAAGGLSSPSANSIQSTSSGNQGSKGDCVVGAWSEWSRCSVSCGAGYQERTRSILSEPGPGGAPCPPRLSRRRRCHRRC